MNTMTAELLTENNELLREKIERDRDAHKRWIIEHNRKISDLEAQVAGLFREIKATKGEPNV